MLVLSPCKQKSKFIEVHGKNGWIKLSGEGQFDYNEFNTSLNSFGLPFFITIPTSTISNQDLAIEFNEEQDARGPSNAYIMSWTQGVDTIFHIVPNTPIIGTGIVGFDNDSHEGKFTITASNTSDDTKTISMKIKPACKVYDRLTENLGLGSPFMLTCKHGDCFDGNNATSFFSCRSNASLWEPGNCITAEFAHPICQRKEGDHRVQYQDQRLGEYQQMFNDPRLNSDYRYFVVCRNPDWSRTTSDVDALVTAANPGYRFDNYGTVNCEEVGF